MIEKPFVPEWAVSCLVDDETFGAAYDGQSGERRAWLKKLIAQIFEMSGPVRTSEAFAGADWRTGFSSRTVSATPDYVAVVLGADCTSASQAVAAALPAVLSGARNVCLVRVGEEGGACDAVLAGMELCGMETVLAMNEAEAVRFIEYLAGFGRGALVVRAGAEAGGALVAQAARACGNMRLWLDQPATRIGVWGADSDWDFETLAWAHPDVAFELWNAQDKADGFAPRAGEFEDFLAQGYDAVFVSQELAEQALSRSGLVLCPGQEGCWAWLDLRPENFRVSGLALSVVSE
ncbi:hypothetical protein GGQ74_000532 [Desulfobaculum xiamenense]|uniref:Uncharacterized protein n=1 Tax=Desulfobaculum xiamenense TaxID=995050 RepID=A0A846QK94_9BACT|nr:hypothetical protein [Desulfobaculum xiamenense]NJB66892.1 hypothetical protein [Desulfobaculum xiamenense]